MRLGKPNIVMVNPLARQAADRLLHGCFSRSFPGRAAWGDAYFTSKQRRLYFGGHLGRLRNLIGTYHRNGTATVQVDGQAVVLHRGHAAHVWRDRESNPWLHHYA